MLLFLSSASASSAPGQYLNVVFRSATDVETLSALCKSNDPVQLTTYACAFQSIKVTKPSVAEPTPESEYKKRFSEMKKNKKAQRRKCAATQKALDEQKALFSGSAHHLNQINADEALRAELCACRSYKCFIKVMRKKESLQTGSCSIWTNEFGMTLKRTSPSTWEGRQEPKGTCEVTLAVTLSYNASNQAWTLTQKHTVAKGNNACSEISEAPRTLYSHERYFVHPRMDCAQFIAITP